MKPSPENALRVFVIEDHHDTQLVLKRYLEGKGHQVVTAGSVSEATSKMRTSEFDVLISDIGLSDGLGWNLLESLHFTKPVVAVAISGATMEEDIARSRKAGFRHHLTKPLRLEVLDQVMEEAAVELSGKGGGAFPFAARRE